MIQLKSNELVFAFPDVHEDARLTIDFQRTLRIPDDDNTYSLPPGLGSFPLAHVDDHADRVPPTWLTHGGVMLSMYQSEAMWLSFDAYWTDDHDVSYPFAVKVATGKVCAVSGETWRNGLTRNPKQNYLAIPKQLWLDGYSVEEGLIRQFVAMPLGASYTAEEQITGEAEHGGLQILVAPMRRSVFEKRFPKIERVPRVLECPSPTSNKRLSLSRRVAEPEMGLAPGGRMRQEIYRDPFDLADYDTDNASRCFVHIANSMVWHSITGSQPPTVPPTADDYTRQGLPWFDYYDGDPKAVRGSGILGALKSVVTLGKKKGDQPLPENTSVEPTNIKQLRKNLEPGQVREGGF